jgi:hypothetical protein
MNLPMILQREGSVPAFVAAGVATSRDPADISLRDAALAHHVAGALAGVLYAILARVFFSTIVSERTAKTLAVSAVVLSVDAFFRRWCSPDSAATRPPIRARW